MLLVFPHGQSCVQRGFSDNEDILRNNIQDETLVSYRMAYDSIKNQDGLIADSITKELLLSCRHAHARYQSNLTKKNKQEESSQKEKRKREVHEQLKSSKKNKEDLRKWFRNLVKKQMHLPLRLRKKTE